jgi:ubiquinone/menaquinone biosynthesis C-methylase UbiE
MAEVDLLATRLMRHLFHLLYNQFAWTYDWVAAVVSRGRWNDWVLTVLPYLEGPLILETGPGTGHLQRALKMRSMTSIAIESSWLMIRQMRTPKERSLLVTFAYAQFMPFAQSAFDQAVATFPSEYITDPRTLTELRRVLRPGGLLVVLPVAWITSPAFPSRLAAGLFRATGQAPPDTRELEQRLAAPFRAAGFQVEVNRKKLHDSQVLLILARNPPEG